MPLKTLLLTLLLFCQESGAIKSSEKRHKQKNYYLYVDAGSSGTRVGIYAFGESEDSPFFVDEEAIFTTKNGKGLQHFLHNLEGLPQYFAPLLQRVESFFQKKGINKVPIYVYATGGMRMLPKADQDKIYTSLRKYLHQVPFLHTKEVRTLEGHEEGLFAWLTVNFLKDRLFSAERFSKTIGVIDIGGATLQVAYEIPPQKIQKDSVKIQIGDNEYKLFIRSHKELGQNIVLKRTESIQKACVGDDDRMKRCFEKVHDVLEKACKKQECALNDELQLTSTQFIAIGGIAHTAREVAHHSFSPEHILNFGKKFCALTRQQVRAKSRGHVDDLDALCFRFAYYNFIFYRDYNAEKTPSLAGLQKTKILVPDEIKGYKSLSWMIGALIYNQREDFSQRKPSHNFMLSMKNSNSKRI